MAGAEASGAADPEEEVESASVDGDVDAGAAADAAAAAIARHAAGWGIRPTDSTADNLLVNRYWGGDAPLARLGLKSNSGGLGTLSSAGKVPT